LKKPKTSVEVEIRTYIKEDTEPKGTDVLAYWAGCQKKSQSCPKWLEPSWPFQLCTSAASEQVFSRPPNPFMAEVFLEAKTCQQLLCLKEWYQSKDLSCLN
jgi:hypothetical protein